MDKDPFTVLSKLLVDDFGINSAVIQRDVVLSELGLDSLTLMEFIFAAEDVFAMRIPEERLDPTQADLTFGAICTVIESMKPSA